LFLRTAFSVQYFCYRWLHIWPQGWRVSGLY
jgi:hypothetical protein